MAALPQPDLLTLEEYLHTAYHPDVEFVDGHLEEKQMGSIPHSLLQAELAFWFNSHRQEWNIRVMSEVRTRVSVTRVRLPDVAIVSRDFPVTGSIWVSPPLIAIEILSPEDRMHRVVKRLDEFLAMGVETIWILDPVERVAFTYTSNGLKLAETPQLNVPDSAIYLDLPSIFAVLD